VSIFGVGGVATQRFWSGGLYGGSWCHHEISIYRILLEMLRNMTWQQSQHFPK